MLLLINNGECAFYSLIWPSSPKYPNKCSHLVVYLFFSSFVQKNLSIKITIFLSTNVKHFFLYLFSLQLPLANIVYKISIHLRGDHPAVIVQINHRVFYQWLSHIYNNVQ